MKLEWSKIVDQVRAMAEIGRTCKAAFVGLASMVDVYPQIVLDEVEAITSAALPIHLLRHARSAGGTALAQERRTKIALSSTSGGTTPGAVSRDTSSQVS